MPRHEVQEGEFISSIALQYQFQDGGDAIWNSNPAVFCEGKNLGTLQQVTGGNREILVPGWEFDIPLKKQKQEAKAHDQSHLHKTSRKPKNLCLTLRDAEGKPLSGTWQYRFDQGVADPIKGSVANGKIAIENIDQTALTAKLTLAPQPAKGIKCPPQQITLHIGGINQIVERPGEAGRSAVQKLLMNQGYYSGEIDGKFGPDTRRAIDAFQANAKIEITGVADKVTCEKLIERQGNTFAPPLVPPAGKEAAMKDPARPLFGTCVGTPIKVTLEKTGTYMDPIQDFQNPKDHKNYQFDAHFFEQAFVAPCDPGDQSKNPNVIRMPANRFILLDTGRWLKNAHDFGLIWGSHVYLCEYVPGGGATNLSFKRQKGLDVDFFTELHGYVNIHKWTSAYWASNEDFDWDTIYLVIPDLHLMNSHVGENWKTGFYTGQHALQSELDLFKFACKLAELPNKLADNLCVIQIGDSYDLWVGDKEYGIEAPLFVTENYIFSDTDKRRIPVLKEDADIQKIVHWIRNIQGIEENAEPPSVISQVGTKLFGLFGSQEAKKEKAPADNWVRRALSGRGDNETEYYEAVFTYNNDKNTWLNPAEAAMRLLDDQFGENMVYIWGNHDNYLGCGYFDGPNVCTAAGLRQRQRWLTRPGLLVEHGHRLEAAMGGSNYDGCKKGYEITQWAYWGSKGSTHGATEWAKDKEGEHALQHDIPEYHKEYARVHLGYQSNGGGAVPHICVIGHTHSPALYDISIVPE